MMADLPASARAQVQRVLDAAARRLLGEQLDRDVIQTTTGSNGDAIDRGSDEGAPLIDAE
jgi:hypothetical protein